MNEFQQRSASPGGGIGRHKGLKIPRRKLRAGSNESTEALNYLKSQLAETSVLDLKESINALIESQLEIQMLANINEDYILIEIEPPFIPEKSVSNDKRLIVIFSTIIGAMLGVLLAIVREFVNRRKLDQISKD